MIFWLVMGVMTAAALFAVIGPLLRRPPHSATDNDLAVYRDQLAEIDRDLSQGTIAQADAEAARLEISRRLLAAADRAEQAAPADAGSKPALAGGWWRRASATALLVLPVGAFALYLTLGSPGLPGQPLAERIARGRATDAAAKTDANTLTSMVARVEAYLAKNPDDGRGWEVLAPIYLRFQRFDDAVKARRNAARLLGETGGRIAAVGEAMTAAAGGIVTPEAKAEFARALTIEPENATAALYLGLAARQAGQTDEARRIWEDMIARAPAGADWVPFVRQAIAELGAPATSGAPDGSTAAPAGPVTAAADLSAEQRDLARGMVERLAARLSTDGSDVEGWLRLVRSYLVLGERDKAQAAAKNARRALAGDPEKLRRLDSGVKELGVEGS
ncbi:MAG: c-type cytochrome biogenesis protein CcmI [Xanthobacteraceae bacterium]